MYSEEPRRLDSDFLKSAKSRLANFHTRKLPTYDPAITELHYIQAEALVSIAQDIRDVSQLEGLEVDLRKGHSSYPAQSFHVRLVRNIRNFYDRIR